MNYSSEPFFLLLSAELFSSYCVQPFRLGTSDIFITHSVHEFVEAISRDELKGKISTVCCRWKMLKVVKLSVFFILT
jgi:hypothetical protein